MKSRSHRASIDQIIAFIVVVMVTFLWVFFLLLDYWTLIKIKDRLDIIAQGGAHWLSKQPLLNNDPVLEQNLSNYLHHILPMSMHITIKRVGDRKKGEIEVNVSTLYTMHNKAIFGEKNISAHFFTYSYFDQNGSYSITIH